MFCSAGKSFIAGMRVVVGKYVSVLLDRKQSYKALFIDVSKAFDSVGHAMLKEIHLK